MLRNISVLAVAVLATGCATSTVTGYRDPDFKQYDSVAVLAYGMDANMAALVESETCKALAPTKCQPANTILPPTRQWSPAEGKAKMMAEGIGALLLIGGAGDRSDTSLAGYTALPGSSTTTGQVTAYGNTANYSQTTSTNPGFAVPIYHHSRDSASGIALMDVAEERQMFVAQLETSGQGRFNVGDGAFAKSAAKKLALELRSQGLVK